MEYKYFTLDKNPKQFKRISIGEYSIELRIEWNTRSKAWYVLGYSGDEIVISNVKLTPNQLYSIDIDSEYDLPYMIGIIPKYTNYDWDTETTFLIVDNPLSNTVEGLTVDGGVIKRSIATSSDTHSRKALKGTENKYLFDVVSITQETGITIVCNGAVDSFKTVNLPQGRWDFTINGMRTITANTEAFRSLMNDYGVQIIDVGNNEYLWANNSDYEIKIEGLYPYAAGYDFNVAESSNESAKIHSVDNNGWVNRFTVCLTPFVDTVWEVYKTDVSEDYNNLVFKGRKSLTGVKPSEEEALLEKYKSGIDPYSATIVAELTGVSDWVLDSNNNSIKYYFDNPPADPKDPTYQYYYQAARDGLVLTGTSSQGAAENYCSAKGGKFDSWNVKDSVAWCLINGSSHSVQVSRTSNPAYDPNAEPEEKSIPLSTVVAQVVSNAADGDVDAKELLNSLNKYDSYAEVEILPLIVDQYKQGLDVYSSGVVNELTGVSDWILDSANNQIVYTDPNQSNPAVYPYLYSNSSFPAQKFPTVSALATYVVDQANQRWSHIGYALDSYTETNIRTRNGKEAPYSYQNWTVTKVANPAYDPTAEEEKKTLPLSTVAQQVISNAESGNVDAQQVVLSAALSPSLVRSLSDSDMQQWQAVKDAIGGLTGAIEWTFDNADKVVSYVGTTTGIQPSDQHIYNLSLWGAYEQFDSLQSLCDRATSMTNWTDLQCIVTGSRISGEVTHGSVGDLGSLVNNPDYDPNYTPPVVSITYQQVADKIVANSIAEELGVSLLAEAYIQEVFRSTATGDVESQLNSNIYNFGVKDVIIEYVDGVIKSTWVSFGFPENVSYYRSNTTMNPDNMPSPLNTGLKDLNSFTDQVVVSAREYIRFGTIKNNHEVISEEFIIEPPLSLLTDINFEVIEI